MGWFRLLVSILIALAIAVRGWRKKSLSTSGALAALLVGTLHMYAGAEFGLTLIAFYLSSSKLTKIQERKKEQLDESTKPGGQRNAWQVLANSAGGCACLVALLALRTLPALESAPQSTRASGNLDQQQQSGGALEAALLRLLGAAGSGLQQQQEWLQTLTLACVGGFLGHYACCCADTWASEVGILSPQPPRLITTGARVPPGTNGGVSMLGTACSLAAGLFIGAVFSAVQRLRVALPAAASALMLLVQAAPSAAAAKQAAAAAAAVDGSSGMGSSPLLALQQQAAAAAAGGVAEYSAAHAVLCTAMVCGVVGCLLDSLLGATLQFSGWDAEKKRVVPHPGPHIQRVSGRPWLSNDAVNAVSAAASCALGAGLLLALTQSTA